MGTLSHEAKFKQDVKTRSKHSVRTEWVDYLGRTMYIHTYIDTFIHTYPHHPSSSRSVATPHLTGLPMCAVLSAQGWSRCHSASTSSICALDRPSADVMEVPTFRTWFEYISYFLKSCGISRTNCSLRVFLSALNSRALA